MENESCKSTELKCWIVTEIRWNKNWVSLSSLKRLLILWPRLLMNSSYYYCYYYYKTDKLHYSHPRTCTTQFLPVSLCLFFFPSWATNSKTKKCRITEIVVNIPLDKGNQLVYFQLKGERLWQCNSNAKVNNMSSLGRHICFSLLTQYL